MGVVRLGEFGGGLGDFWGNWWRMFMVVGW